MDKDHNILIKFASRSRPEKFFNVIDQLYAKADDSTRVIVLCTLDEDDPFMYNQEVVKRLIELKNQHPETFIFNFGQSQNKIDAINRDLELVEGRWSILVNMSDDFEVCYQGWDTKIISDMEDHFPDTDGVLHYSDGYTHEKLCTMSVMGRAYFDRFGYIYHPSYKSLWCDNEFTVVAKNLKRYVYIDDVIARHQHPANVGGVVDDQLRLTESFNDEDYHNFCIRKAKNFPQ